jgi:hypothetical protein
LVGDAEGEAVRDTVGVIESVEVLVGVEEIVKEGVEDVVKVDVFVGVGVFVFVKVYVGVCVPV